MDHEHENEEQPKTEQPKLDIADSENYDKQAYPPLKFRDLFRYASKAECCALGFGVFLSILVGAAFPLTILIFRFIVNDFMEPDVKLAADAVHRTSIWFSVVALCTLATSFTQTFLVDYFSSKLAHRLRLKYFKALLRQDTSWFDRQSVGGLLNQLTEDTTNVQQGVGVKLTEFVQNLSSFFVGLVIAFVVGWKLTLVACGMLPFTVIGFVSFGGMAHYFIRKQTDAYNRASTISEEVFRSIRTVLAFSGEQHESDRYAKHLDDAARVGIKQSSCDGFAAGFIGFSVYAAAALVFWYGVSLLQKNEYDAGSVVLVFLNVIIGSLFLGGALPNIRYFFAAKTSAANIFRTIERTPPIDKEGAGIKPDTGFSTSIRFENVSFSYETRPNKLVLNNFNLTIKPNQTVAFVGPSGCGKSTVMHLLQRFYDPVHGNIFLDNVDLRDINLQWYRSQLGIVQQEPVIFTGSIADNIRFGQLEATHEQIVKAATMANAHQFISSFPDAYDTVITQASSTLSVGQKQRLAIARALVRNPPILILDEATSSLDGQSEQVVQAALDQACTGRTVIIVAHRLSTVRNADQIFVMEDGQISQSGTHEELTESPGLYAALLKAQQCNTLPTSYIADTPLTPAVFGDMDADSKGRSSAHSFLLGNGEKKTESLLSVAFKRRVSSTVKLPKQRSSWMRVLKMNRPEVLFILLGTLSATLTGAIQPMFAILYAEIYAVFTMKNDPDGRSRKANFVTGIMALLGFLRLASSTSQAYFFGISGQRLTKRLRICLFQSILSQDLAWFDCPEHQVGTLTTILASEANKIHPLCGSAMGRLVESTVLLVLSLTVGFFYNWKLTLVISVFFPVIMLSSFLHIKQMSGESTGQSNASASQIAYEALSTDRTVTELALEQYFIDKYANSLSSGSRYVKCRALGFGLVYALAQSLPICSYAAGFSFGAYLMTQREINLVIVFKVFAAISFAAQALGRTAHLGPEMRGAVMASRQIFHIIDRKPAIPVNQGIDPDFDLNTVPIEFKNVSLRYESRPTIPVLKDFTQVFESQTRIAIVGHSGCGKSSLFKLLLRFYNCTVQDDHERGLFINHIRIDKISPQWIRKQMGVVDQEPHLFDVSIRDNITYGDLTREIGSDEVVEAARKADIHDFIVSLPQGYDTLAGRHGSELSIGQKQRIAIARMLIRQPKLILLDEATSALDTQTERRVQSTLDQLAADQSVITSAHRYSALSGADLVIVLADGVTVEVGQHDDLLQNKGAFFALYRSQLTS